MSRTADPARPLVSFIVASYNYERFIGDALKSILGQTVTDLEVVVVDDASTDGSLGVIRSFTDPRIRVYTNEANIGAIKTYNKALALTRGDYIAYVDADDCIDPRKTERQLDRFRDSPELDILGAYVRFVDHSGNRHPRADHYENLFNRSHDLNSVSTWIGWNKLIACSVMLRRSTHERIGPRDVSMTIGSDFELWTRAYAVGCRFGLVEAPLATYRLHDQSISQIEPLATYLEISYLLQKNVLPLIESSSALHLIATLIDWHVSQPQFGELHEAQQHRLLGLLLGPNRSTDCLAYRQACLFGDDPTLLALGRRFHAAACLGPAHAAQVKIDELRGALAIRDRDIAWRDEQLLARDRDIAWRDNEVKARDRQIAWHEAELAARDRDIAWRDNQIAAHQRDIAWRDEAIAERDRLIERRRWPMRWLRKLAPAKSK